MSQVEITEKAFSEIVDEVIDTAELDRYYEVKREMVAEKLRPYFKIMPDNVAQLPKPYDRTHGGRVSKEGAIEGVKPVKMEAIPYEGTLWLRGTDVIELAQKLQTSGEGFQSFITHILPYTTATAHLLAGGEGDGRN